MPLDPQARALLDQIEAAGAPPPYRLEPEEARAGFSLVATMIGPPDVRVPTEDRAVPGAAGAVPVRVYRPASGGAAPVVVYFHGGGWVIGDLDSCDTICHRLSGGVPAVVVSVDYRLAPEYPYPAAVDDCDAVTTWVAEHAGELGADPSRLAVAGDSAGGNLAAVVARRARDRGGPPIAFQLLVYPVTDATRSLPSYVENGSGYLLDADTMAWFYRLYLAGADPEQPDVSPLFVEDCSGLPPGLVVTAEFDPLRDEGEAYAERLRLAGVDVATSRYDGMIHMFYGFDTMFDAARRATTETVSALRVALA